MMGYVLAGKILSSDFRGFFVCPDGATNNTFYLNNTKAFLNIFKNEGTVLSNNKAFSVSDLNFTILFIMEVCISIFHFSLHKTV